MLTPAPPANTTALLFKRRFQPSNNGSKHCLQNPQDRCIYGWNLNIIKAQQGDFYTYLSRTKLYISCICCWFHPPNKRSFGTRNITHQHYVPHIIPSQSKWSRLSSFILEAARCRFHQGQKNPSLHGVWSKSICGMPPSSGKMMKCAERKERTLNLSSIPFINITCYKKNKVFSVNELSNSIMSVDYRWDGMLIPIVVCSRIKNLNTINLAFCFYSEHHTPFFLEVQCRLDYQFPAHLHGYSHAVTLISLLPA